LLARRIGVLILLVIVVIAAVLLAEKRASGGADMTKDKLASASIG
jgi:Sec-independent protein translocase protein TatA